MGVAFLTAKKKAVDKYFRNVENLTTQFASWLTYQRLF